MQEVRVQILLSVLGPPRPRSLPGESGQAPSPFQEDGAALLFAKAQRLPDHRFSSYARVRYDPGRLPADRRNLAWMMFTDPDNRARLASWEPSARSVISQFRAAAGQRPDDPRFTELVAVLSEASPEFKEWWADYPIRYFRPATVGIDHPRIGRIMLEIFQLRLVEHPDLLMVVQVPARSEDLERVASLLDRP
jgi:hypothetical protein